MISDKERRRAVAELREASTGAYRHVDALDVIAGSIGVEVAGKFSHEVEKETYAALADLINRPTCHEVETVEEEGYYGTTLVHRKFSCGHEYVDAYSDAPMFCPRCGAVVMTDGNR